MQAGDLPAVHSIESRAYPNPWSEAIFRDCLRVGYPAWVLEQDGVPVGYGLLSVSGDEAHVLNLCIDPQRQGRGFGRRLLDHLVRMAGKRGARVMYLEVRPSNRHAIELYHSTGFVEVGRRKDYYPDGDGREDAVLYSLVL